VLKFKPDEPTWLQGEPDEVIHSVETQRRLQHGIYAELLRRKLDDESSDSEDDRLPRRCRVYNPYFLDDPEMRISKDRTVIKQEGYVVSCIPYVKPRTMKEELNGLFLAKHGDWLEDREVTLSKVRALKTQMVEIVKMLDLDLSTAAMAHVYLEKLILKNLVRKHSRKVTAGVCLMLAVKFNEVPDENQMGMDGGGERQDCRLFIASNDPLLPLPQDLLRHVRGLLAKAEDAKQLLKNRPYVIVSCRDPKAAREARKVMMAHSRVCGHRLTADFIPTTAVGKNGRGKACAITELLGCISRVLGVHRKAVNRGISHVC